MYGEKYIMCKENVDIKQMLIMYSENVKHVYIKCLWCVQKIWNTYRKVDTKNLCFKYVAFQKY